MRPAAFLTLIVVLPGWHRLAWAQDAQSRQVEADQPTAPVVVDGITLFNVRGVSAYPAEQRAAAISDRIAAAAKNPSLPVDSVVVREMPQATAVNAAETPLFRVVDADAQLEGVGRQVLAAAYRERVVAAIERYRHDRQPAVLGWSLGKAALATLALVVALWLGLRVLRLARRTLDQRYRSRLHDVRFQTIELVRAEHLWQGLNRLFTALAILVALLLGYAYLQYVLLLFPWTRGLGLRFSGMVLGPVAALGLGAVGYIPDLVFLVVLALVTRALLRIVHVFFGRLGDGTLKLGSFDPDWAVPSDRIARILIIAFALVLAYPHLPGSGSEAFKGISLMIGLIFSLGSSTVIGNLIAGQSLAYRRAFKVGDRIKVGEHIGEVSQVRLLTTYLRSPKNEQIVIPNSTILNTEVVNFSTLARERGLILHTIVGIGYETPWRQVEAMLLEAAGRTPGLLRTPPPFVLQRALGTFAIDYEINAYCDNPQQLLALYSALHANILDVFNEYGVQIMTPAYEGDPEQPKLVAPEQRFAAPARPNGGAATSHESRVTNPELQVPIATRDS